ncbi:TPA: hypothetical protein HA361_00275 [Candidatus Woesearchaeota archaeon]|nr:hypothetical protein [Candidatus Woesearchaeota archaeon]HII68403.1 hypothetical protein [Candidatus Woesearchaeota archaeon]
MMVKCYDYSHCMKIAGGITINGLALEAGGRLIIADTHMGYEEAMNMKGILIPLFQFSEMMKRLESIVAGQDIQGNYHQRRP